MIPHVVSTNRLGTDGKGIGLKGSGHIKGDFFWSSIETNKNRLEPKMTGSGTSSWSKLRPITDYQEACEDSSECGTNSVCAQWLDFPVCDDVGLIMGEYDALCDSNDDCSADLDCRNNRCNYSS